MGSAAAPAAVRCALAPNTTALDDTKTLADFYAPNGLRGAAHCARGGRAPHSKAERHCPTFCASLFLLLFLQTTIAAPTDSFATGLEAYQGGDFNRAADAFRKSAEHRPASGTLQNLGNARWQQGRVGDAIRAWEQALWLNPYDRNARNNLRFGREKAQLEEPRLAWYEAASAWLPVHWWSWIVGLSLWVAVGAIILPPVFRRQRKAWHQALAALSLGVFLLSIPAQLGTLTRSRIGFVLEKNTVVRLTPTAEAEAVTRLSPGDAVRVVRKRGDYRFVRTSTGSGWVRQDEIGLIGNGN